MSVYDHRDIPAYVNNPVPIHYCENEHILNWWNVEHDNLIKKLIVEKQWSWFWCATDEIINITPAEVINNWRSSDPLCNRYAWYNILMYFAIARAQKLDLLKYIREPQWKNCPLCKNDFIEISLPQPLIERLGINQIDFCSPCLRDAVLWSGDETLPKQEIITYLANLANAINKIPHQNYGNGINDLEGYTTEERLRILKLLLNKPSVIRVKKEFKSWLEALIVAGVLEDGTRRTSRGTQCIAKDGHVCYSLAEKTIDDYMFIRNIKHEKEPHYPEGNLRADFLVNDIFIEYFGLRGDLKYDEKTKLKKEICARHCIQLISIFNEDLVSSHKLDKKLSL